MVYPKNIAQRLLKQVFRKPPDEVDGSGADVNLGCGSTIRFSLALSGETDPKVEAFASSNGCGYMAAASSVLIDLVSGGRLTDLHGLTAELENNIAAQLGEIPFDRMPCIDASVQALRLAFADLRSRRIEEFRGERALVCTCFGVSEDRIAELIQSRSLTSVDEVSMACKAGSGCGSCRMMIQEMVDNAVGM